VDPETLSRWQFAFTASFHFIFPPLSMGLGIMLVAIGVKYLWTKDPKWRQLAFFWTQVYALIFALGVATGVVQEFEFGTNWSNYSRYVGNVFGSLLAAEGIFAFFLEGGFLGLMLFGANRLGPRLWLGATFVVVFAAHFSALWIVMANSWMQTPEGYKLVGSGSSQHAEMTSFVDVMFTPSFVPHIMHIYAASWTAGAALMLSVSAWYILRGRNVELAKSNFRLALPFFAIFAISNLVIFGANQAVEVTNQQEVKLAAIEGLWDDQSCAPLYVAGWVDEGNQSTHGIKAPIPCLLSFLSYGDKDATVKGLNSFSEDDWPPVQVAFQAYHLMIDLAMLFALIAVIGAGLYLWRQRIFRWRWALWMFVLQMPLTSIAIIAGWWTAEVGRQPWIVWNLMKTEDGVSPTLTTGQLIFSLSMFTALYAVLFVLFLYLLNAKIQRGPAPLEEVETTPVSALPDTFREIFRRRGARDSAAGPLAQTPTPDTREAAP
jgi:cytochrome d ubiquinol oxidase subunit I